MPRSRREGVAIGFMIVWLTVWAAGMLIVLWGLGAALMRGEAAAILFMGVWLAAAAFAFVMGARRLRALMLEGKAPGRSARRHGWEDGVIGREQR